MFQPRANREHIISGSEDFRGTWAMSDVYEQGVWNGGEGSAATKMSVSLLVIYVSQTYIDPWSGEYGSDLMGARPPGGATLCMPPGIVAFIFGSNGRDNAGAAYDTDCGWYW